MDGWFLNRVVSVCHLLLFVFTLGLNTLWNYQILNSVLVFALNDFFLTGHKTVQQLRESIIKWLFSSVSFVEGECLYPDRWPSHEAVAVCTCSWIGDLHDCHWYLTVSTLVLVTDWTSVWLQLHLHSLHWWSVSSTSLSLTHIHTRW